MAKPKIEIDGLKELRKEIRKVGDETLKTAMKEANVAVASLVVPGSKTKAPKASGALAASIRVTNTVNYAAIRAGSARIPYAGIYEYGWPARGIKPQRYVAKTIGEKYREIIKTYEAAIEEIGKRLAS